MLFSHFYQLMNIGQLDACDVVLESLDISLYPKIVLVGICRVTYPARRNLDSWDGFVEKVLTEHDSPDFRHKMRGLLPEATIYNGHESRDWHD